jgi:hypothetical protein
MDPDVQHAVVLGESPVVLAIEHLQRPEPQQDRGDRRDDHCGQDGYA